MLSGISAINCNGTMFRPHTLVFVRYENWEWHVKTGLIYSMTYTRAWNIVQLIAFVLLCEVLNIIMTLCTRSNEPLSCTSNDNSLFSWNFCVILNFYSWQFPQIPSLSRNTMFRNEPTCYYSCYWAMCYGVHAYILYVHGTDLNPCGLCGGGLHSGIHWSNGLRWCVQ